MAYQTRQREPLLDSNTAEAIEKRGKELLGIGLVVLGVMAAMMIGSYTPDDPNWMLATDAPAQNWLGRMGASLAAPLFMIVGWGAWGLAVVLLVWGVRFALHRGQERAMGRLIFAPIAVALGAIYAATLTPDAEWLQTHSFGLGGLFGDTIMGVILTLLPIGSTFTVKLMSLVMGVGILALGAFVLGFTKSELTRFARFLLVGTIMVYAALMNVLGRSATGAVAAAQGLQAKQAVRRQQRRAEQAEASVYAAEHARAEVQVAPAASRMPRLIASRAAQTSQTPEYAAEPEYGDEDGPKTSLLARMPGLIKRPDAMPEPELVERHHQPVLEQAPSEERIKTKISDVIKSRVRSTNAVHVPATSPLTRGRGRGPDPLVLNTTRAEPPLTARSAQAPAAAPSVARPVSAPTPAPISSIPDYADASPNENYDALTEPFNEDDVNIFVDSQMVEETSPQVAAPKPLTFTPTKIPVPEAKRVVMPMTRKAVPQSKQAQAEAQPVLSFEDSHRGFELPPLSLLESPEDSPRQHLSDEALEENARMLESVLDDYGVKGEIVAVRPGPVVTMYELEPAPGLKASRVIGLADDIARSMAALSARVSTVPGRSVIGIELPNEHREKVVLREILSSRDFGDGNQNLPLALGKDIGGEPVVANLAKMPHLLIAGTTGSGKSVAINTMILSLLYKLSPEECRMIMIDPKMLELSVYDGIPHLLSPVVTDPKKALVALKWTVGEMEDRYRKMSKMGVRNIEGYNGRVKEALAKGEMFSRTVQTGFDDDTGEPIFETEENTPVKLPYIVVIVDEMADLMMVAGKEIEACIQRLAQMARASGIHLIMATQRPSVDVITGTIKANFPTRISFQVTSKIDSRTILGEMGAEQLLGMGDMLYMAGGSKVIRCHGPFVSDEEVEEIVNHLKQFGEPEYVSGVVEGPPEDTQSDIDSVLGLNTGGNTDSEDALYDTAVAIVTKDRKCSTSYIQRKLAIGYNKAARLVEQMEDEGLVSPANHVGKREILVPEQG
ncbi:DNA translocase FtsK [Sulfitobacter guttiformis]|uniref:DNA translocase FtsK n=1 Tax=Sulfitobacter guttiformis TaxID=74349 RepID=A0A420DT09_9RHOB|nr:DNA translocase FtsK [Sulfitobacter guttiformis]KIN74723.1 Cell division protein FtsK [Sulfitobacter guttiformis KCTC 32187]RKE97298.1 DNA translocase FtsK [Sulfitobacter guttiformis]